MQATGSLVWAGSVGGSSLRTVQLHAGGALTFDRGSIVRAPRGAVSATALDR